MKCHHANHGVRRGRSHPSRGAWIEMPCTCGYCASSRSHPSRGAWIEIPMVGWPPMPPLRRTPHGVRGLKSCAPAGTSGSTPGRTPHGVRGLKCLVLQEGTRCGKSHPSRGAWIEIIAETGLDGVGLSHPSRGAWIEMPQRTPGSVPCFGSHPSRGAWIEISAHQYGRSGHSASHPSRGAWIEITYLYPSGLLYRVAPLTGCVD